MFSCVGVIGSDDNDNISSFCRCSESVVGGCQLKSISLLDERHPESVGGLLPAAGVGPCIGAPSTLYSLFAK